MTATLYNTNLQDRILWYDGESSFDSSSIQTAMQRYSNVRHVTTLTNDILAYNRIVPTNQSLTIKTTCAPLSLDWNIPDEYSNLNVIDWITTKHNEITQHLSSAERSDRNNRLNEELRLYETFNLIPVLRAVIYIINTLTTNNVVWGIGRGSSTSSYVLYTIGVHDVDSYLYNLDIHDFLH